MRVLIFGDSITQGFWDSEGGWVSRIRKVYDAQKVDGSDDNPPSIFNLGVSADSSDDVLARLENETKARASEKLALVFAIGVNDSRTEADINFSTPEQYAQNLTAIIATARQFSDKILFVGLTPCVDTRTNPVSWGESGYTNTRIDEFDRILREVCEQNQVEYVEILQSFQKVQKQGELLPDGVHPNDQGHQLIAGLVLPVLQKLLIKPQS